MDAVSFLLDECVPEYLQDEIIRLEPAIEILQAGQDFAPRKGTPDPELLLFAEKNRLTFVSRDKKTMPGHLDYAPIRYAEDLVLIWSCFKLEEMADFMAYLPM